MHLLQEIFLETLIKSFIYFFQDFWHQNLYLNNIFHLFYISISFPFLFSSYLLPFPIYTPLRLDVSCFEQAHGRYVLFWIEIESGLFIYCMFGEPVFMCSWHMCVTYESLRQILALKTLELVKTVMSHWMKRKGRFDKSIKASINHCLNIFWKKEYYRMSFSYDMNPKLFQIGELWYSSR